MGINSEISIQDVIDNLLDNNQPQAGSAFLGGDIRGIDILQFFRRETGAAILYYNFNAVVFPFDLDIDSCRLRRCLDGILYDIA